MAKDDDAWKRFRDREDEAEALEAETKVGRTTKQIKISVSGASSEKMDDLISRADVLVEQLNNLYHMYAVGIERIPPNERRSQLDQVMLSLQFIGKPTASALFRYHGMHSRYVSYRDRWDKIVKDVESGKIKRTAGPKRTRALKKT